MDAFRNQSVKPADDPAVLLVGFQTLCVRTRARRDTFHVYAGAGTAVHSCINVRALSIVNVINGIDTDAPSLQQMLSNGGSAMNHLAARHDHRVPRLQSWRQISEASQVLAANSECRVNECTSPR
jgi:hypothetical protein